MEERIKRLMNAVKCGHCGENYLSHNVKVVGNSNGLWYINAYCTSCHSQFVIAATLCGDKPALISDLKDEEAARFTAGHSPNADDVLDMHTFLKNFDGDFGTLFGREWVS
jgi:hypothetical protein